MPIIRRCKKCKTKLASNEDICPSCGHDQRAQTEQQAVTMAAPDPVLPPPGPVAEPQKPAEVPPAADSPAGVRTGAVDENIEKLKQINKMILRSKNLPDSGDESEHEEKTITLVESLELPDDLNSLLNLYSDLRVLKLRTKSYIQGDVDEAIMNTMGNIIQTAKMKFGAHPRISMLEKDFNKLKREKYMMMLLGLGVIVMVLYLIFK